MSDSEIASLVDAISVMLAAFGFVYAASVDRFAPLRIKAGDLFDKEKTEIGRQYDLLQSAKPVGLSLAIAPTAVVIVFGTVAIKIIQQINFNAPYSAIRTSFVILLGFWLLLAIAMWARFKRLCVRTKLLKGSLDGTVSVQHPLRSQSQSRERTPPDVPTP